jgi:hypothetical protein
MFVVRGRKKNDRERIKFFPLCVLISRECFHGNWFSDKPLVAIGWFYWHIVCRCTVNVLATRSVSSNKEITTHGWSVTFNNRLSVAKIDR